MNGKKVRQLRRVIKEYCELAEVPFTNNIWRRAKRLYNKTHSNGRRL